MARVLLTCSLVMAVPIGLAVATATFSAALAEAAAQSADRHQVRATLVDDAPLVTGGDAIAPATARAAVVWTGPSGRAREDVVAVPAGAKAGSTVPLWVDREGERTTRPLSDGAVVARAAGIALLTYLCISAAAVGCYLAFRGALDRSRLRRWENEWAVVEPVWTRTVR